jgi:hypothetical protein
MKLSLFILMFSVNSLAQDRYVLPKDIIVARDQLIASKQKLDRDILNSYFGLCNKLSHNAAEHIEFLAYQEITGLQCWQILLK